MHGVHIEKETVCFGSWGKEQTEYEQEWNGVRYRIVNDGSQAERIRKRRKTLCGSVGDACDHETMRAMFADATLRAFPEIAFGACKRHLKI